MELFENRYKILTKCSEILANSRSIRNGLAGVLETLLTHTKGSRGFTALLDEETETYSIYAAEGFDAAEFRRLENQIKKISAAEILNAESFPAPNKTLPAALFGFSADTEESDFFQVFIKLNKKSVGILCIETKPDTQNRSEYTKFLSVAASMIAQAIKSEIEIADEKERIFEEHSHLRQELREKYDFDKIIGNSSPMRQVYAQVAQVARSNATVLLRGESGTGKEMIAAAIHYNSLRSKKPFVAVNCAALPETLIESEFFGYEKGAFTGANQRKKGRFELADGGTLFLDEIGDLPPQTQVKLLRVLQEREFERLGGTETIKVNVRLIAATNKDLEKEIAENNFREDLFYRLNVFTIFLPPLRERKSDILLLAEHFLEKYEKAHNKRIRRISTPAIDMLTAYHYPGNVRELENAVERAVVACDENVVHGHHLPPSLQTAEVSGTITNKTLESAVIAFEKDLIQDALKTVKGNRTKAAGLLNTTERIINYKIKKYGINPKRFKE